MCPLRREWTSVYELVQTVTTGRLRWRAQTQVLTGRLGYTDYDVQCGEGYYTERVYTYYEERLGTKHNISPPLKTQDVDPACTHNPTKFPVTVQVQDGYALTLTCFDPNLCATVTTPDGALINLKTGNATFTDNNGNQIRTDGTTFTDTLGVAALKVTGTTNPSKFSYLKPSGQYADVTLTYYQNVTVATSFKCASVQDVTINNVSLIKTIGLPDGSSYSLTYEPNPYNSNYVTGRIASITLPTGGSISYSYSDTTGNNGINCSDGTVPILTRTVTPGGQWTYTRTQVSGTHWQTKVTSPPDPTVGNDTVIDFQQDSSSSPTYNFYETQRKAYQGSSGGTPLSTTVTCYNQNHSSCTTATLVSSPITRKTVFRYLPNSSGSQAETDTVYDTNGYGLVTDVYDYDYGSGGVGSLLRHTATTYASLGNGIIDRPATVKIYDGGSNLKASTQYTYDEFTVNTSGATQHVQVTGSRGNLTTIAAQAASSTTLYRKFTYYDTGTLLTSSDVNTSNTGTNLTTYTYSSSGSCDFAFPTSITEPLSLSRSMTYDCKGGVLLSLTDENGKISSTAYNGTNYDNVFWRPYSTTDQAGNTTLFTYSSPNESETSLTLNSNSVVDHVTTVDGLGRVVISQTWQGPNSSTYDSVETTYDALGRVIFVTLPYAAGKGASCSGSCPGTTTSYDALYRVSSVSDGGGGSKALVYTNNDVYQTIGPAPTGENPKRKQLEYDGLGRLSSVCEITSSANGGGTCTQQNSATGYWTKYSHDALGDLTGVTQNAQNTQTYQTRTYSYDMLGRITSEANPETGGTAATYAYDSDSTCTGGSYPVGNLLKRVDAAQNKTCYSWDALHRPTQISYPNSTNTPTKNFAYDSSSLCGTGGNLAGRLAEAYTGSGTKITDRAYCYSARGEVTDIFSSTQNSNGTYHVTKGYWPSGAVASIGNIPGVPTIYYGANDGSGLDGEGRYTKVTASSGQNPVTCNNPPCVTYNVASQVTQVDYGSGDIDQFTYDANTGRMKGYQYNVGAQGKYVTGLLGWNANGTLQTLTITDPFNSTDQQSCSYTYDDLARVGRVSCNGVGGGLPWGQQFSYDPFGNIQKQVLTGYGGTTFLPSYNSNTNQYSSLCGQLSYDSDGRLTNDCFHSYQWDVDSHPVAINEGLQTNETYDALGNYAESNYPYYGWTGQNLYDSDGTLLGGSTSPQTAGQGFIPLPGGGTANYYSGSLQQYWHPDWVGSVRFASTASQTMYEELAFAPFGESYSGAGNSGSWVPFASLIQQAENDQYHTLFREYNTTQGRWITPDPAGLAAADPSNPQTWNRYAYVANNPLSFVDPLGLLLEVPPCFADPTVEGQCFPPGWPIEGPIGVGIGWDGGGGGGGGGGNGGGGGAGNGNPSGPSGPPVGIWQERGTFGLPPRVVYGPLDLGSLFGLTPGTECDFGVCNPIGNGFLQEPVTDTAIGIAALLRGIAALGLLYEVLHPPKGSSDNPLTPHQYEICTPNRVEVHADLGLKACYYECSDGAVILGDVVNLNESCPTYHVRKK